MLKNKTFAQRKLILLAILAGALALLVAAGIIVNAVIKNLDTGEGGGDEPEFDLIEGETYYLGIPLVYSPFTSGQINALVVRQDNREFTIARMPQYKNNFVFSFNDGTGDEVYLPTIAFEDAYFDYTTLYAEDAMVSGSASMPKLTYVCSAVGMLYYDERIPLSEDDDEQRAQLTEYGFDMKSPIITVSFSEPDENGKTVNKKHTIKIGGKVITDSAYYFMIDDRPYVYATTTPYFDYALMSLEELIDANLIAAGVSSDASFGPRLTPDYKQWKNTTYYYEVDENGKYTYYSSNGETKVDPWLIPEGAQIYCKVSTFNPIDFTAGYYISDDAPGGKLKDDSLDGYRSEGKSEQIFDLLTFTHANGFGYAMGVLKDLPIGKYDEPVRFTGIGDYNTVNFGKGESKKSSVTYSYVITAIETLFGDGTETSVVGTPVGQSDRIKVTYTYKIDGADPKYDIPCHTVLDLSKDGLIPAEALAKLRAASVGELNESVSFDITYTEQNAIKRTTRLIITDVFRVYSADGMSLENQVYSDSIVSFRYYYEVDGVAMGEPEAFTLALGTVNNESSESYQLFKQALVGKRLELDQNIEVSTSVVYCQPTSNFIAYEIEETEFYVTSELVAAFRFLNSSYRDPFLRESIFESTMGDDHEFGLYAINSYTCESVVGILGGSDSDSSGAQGYKGLETVSVDLSAENMKKYGLFAHKIYFELPRGVYSPDYAAEYTQIDYAWYETLGFTLYISDEKFDENGELCRYVASTMYNLIAKVDPEDFAFLDYSFIDLWARRNMYMVDIKDIDELDVQLNMSDLKGSYHFGFGHLTEYYVKGTNKVWYDKNDIPEGVSYSEYDILTLSIKPTSEGATSSLFKDYYEGKTGAVAFNDFYEHVTGVAKSGRDDIATANMKEFSRILLNVTYNGTLTKEEQEEAAASDPLMSLTFKLSGVPYRYGYDFHRMDDRRVMVSIYRVDTNGEKMQKTSYFYVSTPTFKKIAGAVDSMLNAETLDADVAYQD